MNLYERLIWVLMIFTRRLQRYRKKTFGPNISLKKSQFAKKDFSLRKRIRVSPPKKGMFLVLFEWIKW